MMRLFLLVLLAGTALASPLRKRATLQSLAVSEEAERASTTGPIVRQEETLDKFGYPKYAQSKDLDWADMKESQLGRKCSMAKDADDKCGKLICRKGFCSYCAKDDECPKLHRCTKRGEGTSECVPKNVKAWESAVSDRHEFMCSLAILVAAALAASAGTGGGSIFVPVLISLSQLTEKSAVVAISQFMIFVSSTINLSVFVVRRHPDFPELPVIDYDCIVVLIPMLCLGVTFGVLVNRTSPSWLVLVLLCGTLCMALQKTATKGLKQLRQEQAMIERQVSDKEEDSAEEKKTYGEALGELVASKSEQVAGVVACWLIMMASNMHGLPVCSMRYVLFLCIMAGLLTLFAVFMKWRLQSTSHLNPVDWLSGTQDRSSFTFPLVALGTGFLGSMLGLGGGILLSPVLMEAGVHAEAVQATTAAFVFLSSSIATIQYLMMGQIVWHYALWYGGIAAVSTVIGQYLCEVYIRKRKRYSLITLAVAAVLFLSLACLLWVGTGNVYDDYEMGRPYFFTSDKLCDAGKGTIIQVHKPKMLGDF
eukprot:TRINITY_DN103133_c0_g1_i1.p1 TRINITY_DN103133_c0_g1~~TRINITY_DN103133_c0_g1_i1.p1  ORF type:complete len:536 (-),score=75.42 TRINITY_DN103133_c0_g1_i1:37-1644(-)